jgi:hypothetical protein
MPSGLRFRLQDYLELIDWTGRQIRNDNRAQIDQPALPIFELKNSIGCPYRLILKRLFPVIEPLMNA